jgi:6,7-dimethyl-8-ribityllumazine synthase
VPRHLQATPSGTGLRIGVAVARFNQAVTDQLLAGTLDALVRPRRRRRRDRRRDRPRRVRAAALRAALAAAGRYDALVCLGAVVRGETPHFDFVAGEAARGIADVARRHDLPVAFGVLTTDTIEQALARAGGERGNKGYEAAVTALEMVQVLRAVQRY